MTKGKTMTDQILQAKLEDAQRALREVIAAYEDVKTMVDSVSSSKDAPIENNPFYTLGAIQARLRPVVTLAEIHSKL